MTRIVQCHDATTKAGESNLPSSQSPVHQSTVHQSSMIHLPAATHTQSTRGSASLEDARASRIHQPKGSTSLEAGWVEAEARQSHLRGSMIVSADA